MNASWVSVRELESIGVGNDVQLITKEIPVEYETVSTIIPKLWQQYQPKV